ncbi:unnamed protein product [Owenia fusiformis]|uniref:Uncharacterized protein n=1 Tax=Owenia fusiformis TaxID=6347 RepID=A0A8J1T8T1_OWEFU|nr:unnamed protein product [Owenia fusiformis]
MGIKASTLNWFDQQKQLSYRPKKSQGSFTTVPPRYNHRWTDLHYAASHGNLRRIQEIIHKGGTFNIDKQDYYGKTALYWACYKGHSDCVEELLKFGAKINIVCRHGGTALHAVAGLYPECAKLLIQHGADVNHTDKWGVTPMYIAACNGQFRVIEYLIAAGAKLTYKNNKTGDIPKPLSSHKELCEQLQFISLNPPSLQHLCRTSVRQHVAEYPMQKLLDCHLPKPISDYLILSDL